MGNHCPFCGTVIEEDDNRPCPTCANSHKWRPWQPGCDDCPSCGDDPEVFTSCRTKYQAYDGDRARCVCCGHPGSVYVYGDEEEDDGNGAAARIKWHDDPDCSCVWCVEDRKKQTPRGQEQQR